MKKKLTPNYLKEISSPKSYSKGEKLFFNKSVYNLKIEKETITANVIGGKEYKVDVYYDENKINFKCTCPYDYAGICKHCIAVGFEIIEREIDFTKDSKKIPTNNSQVDDLLEYATHDKIRAFLKQILSESSFYTSQFEIFLKGQSAVEENIDITSLRLDFLEAIESFDVDEYESFCDCDNYSYGYYRDEWEVMYENAFEEFQDLLNIFFVESESFLNTGDVINAFKYYIGIYEGIILFDQSKIKDESGIFDGIEYELISIWKRKIKVFEEYLANNKTQPKAALRIIEILFERIILLKKESLFIKVFQVSILHLIVNNSVAEELLAILKKNELLTPNTDEIQLKIYSVTGNNNLWEQFANQYYKSNKYIAHDLLNYYADNKNDDKYLIIAEYVFNLWPDDFDEELYNYLKMKSKSKFLEKVLINFTIRTEQINLFKQLKKDYGDDSVEKLLEDIENENSKNNFYIKVLIQLKDFSTILKYLEKNINNDNLDFMVKPIINIYPEQCYLLIKKKIEIYLEKYMGRDFYKTAVKWMQLLTKIEDNEIKFEVGVFFESLIKFYWRRRALADEMKILK